jgi:hypothetical protein
MACASRHKASQTGVGRAQPRVSASQPSSGASPCQPGSSAQVAAVQCDFGAAGAARDAAAAALAPSAGAAADDGCPAGGVGPVTGAGERDSTNAGSPPPGPAQPPSKPRIAAAPTQQPIPNPRTILTMWLILLEALGALALLVLIVWWTMFAGRDRGEPRDEA